MPSDRRQFNIRLSDQAHDLIDQLTAALDCSRTQVVTQALRHLAKQELGQIPAEKKSGKKPSTKLDRC